MRKMLSFLKCLFCFFCGAACAFALYAVWNEPVFNEGKTYTYYLGENSSSSAVITHTPALTKLQLGGAVAGESTVYDGDLYEELKEKFRARLCFCETVCGIVNYYLHAQSLGTGVMLCGYSVNLHIAVNAASGTTAVGTPLIFGGY